MKNGKQKQPTGGSKPLNLTIKNFAHLADVNLTRGDLTVLVGPQGAGKSLALQWFKAVMDGGQIVTRSRQQVIPRIKQTCCSI